MKEKAENILCAEGCPETLPTVFFKIMCMKMFYKISTNKSKYENATCSYRRTGGLPLYFHVLTGEFRFVVYLSMATFNKSCSINLSESDLCYVKMSEFFCETHISPIRAFVIALQSPTARTLFKKFINS